MLPIRKHTHLCIELMREREIYMLGEGAPIWGLVFVFLIHLYRGIFARFSSPRGFPKINLYVLLSRCACLYFSDPFEYGYDVMMLNVIIYCINIKKITWYQRYTEISIFVPKTLLQLHVLNIRVSCLKTLEYKN